MPVKDKHKTRLKPLKRPSKGSQKSKAKSIIATELSSNWLKGCSSSKLFRLMTVVFNPVKSNDKAKCRLTEFKRFLFFPAYPNKTTFPSTAKSGTQTFWFLHLFIKNACDNNITENIRKMMTKYLAKTMQTENQDKEKSSGNLRHVWINSFLPFYLPNITISSFCQAHV